MVPQWTAAAFFLLASLAANAAPDPGTSQDTGSVIALPQDDDDYTRLVAQAAARDSVTDFRALRFAWLDSKARRRHSEISLRPDVIAMMKAAQAGDNQQVRERALVLLSKEFISITGQSYLLGSCDALSDKICSEQARFVAVGLVKSIQKSGDGKTCETGWEVAMVEEEYAMLRLMGLRFKQQALIMGKGGSHSCDAMSVTDENGKDVTYYFTIDRVMADEMKMLGIK
jgi:hypothetical protein